MTTRVTAPRRPRRCGLCSMFGHDRRTCHLSPNNPHFPQDAQYRMALAHWRMHCDINAGWVAEGGEGLDVPEPQPPKTPFELACENKCKITKAEECCICMEALGDKNTATTACGHQFHFGCLAQHTSTSNSCPMCRAVICPELPKRELKLPSNRDITFYGQRALRPMVAIMSELSVGTEADRHLVAEGVAMLVSDSISHILTAVRRVNQ